MPAEIVQSGCYLDYTPAADVVAGTPVDLGGGLIGIPANDIDADVLGSVAIGGVHKVANSGVAFAVSAVVGYDATNDQAVAAGGGDFDLGPAVYVAGATDDVYFLLNDKTL